MKALAAKTFGLLLCGMFGAGILTTSCKTVSQPVKEASPMTLLDTSWRLTQLGDEVIENPPGAKAVNFLLQPSNTGLVGFSGCNRMFGQYALEGSSLKFDGMGGTRMFCEAHMDLEQKFLAMFGQVAGWKIEGTTLQLLDNTGKAIATFNTP
ncbi:MAG TPA: META domain-containing protein [Steroidobacteraceae bacterium]|nr:META domain-containing protein [Steroidobacteraceae bacterium]